MNTQQKVFRILTCILFTCTFSSELDIKAQGPIPIPLEMAPKPQLSGLIGLETTFDALISCDSPTAGNEIQPGETEFLPNSCCGDNCYGYRVALLIDARMPKWHNWSNEYIGITVANKVVWEADRSQISDDCSMQNIKEWVMVDLVGGEHVELKLILNETDTGDAYARVEDAVVVDAFMTQNGGGSCYGDCFSGAVYGNNSVSFNLDFGMPSVTSTNLGAIGTIRLTELKPSVALCQATRLQYVTKGDGAEVIREPTYDHCIRQIKGADGLADVIVVDSFKYEVKLYKPSDVLSKVNGLYQTQGSPEVTYTICNPSQSTQDIDTLLILETRDSLTKTNKFEWDSNNEGWTLTRPVANVAERRLTTWNQAKDERTETLEKYDPTNNQVHYQSISKYKLFDTLDDDGDRAEAVIERKIGSGANALISTYDYYSSTNDNGYMQLKEGHFAGGGWEYNTYDSNDRLLVSYTAFATNHWSSVYTGGIINTNLCRTIVHDYTPLSGASDNGSKTNAPRTTIEYVAGKEIARSYLVIKDGEERLIQCQTPGAAWNNSSNLVTINKYLTSGSFSNALQSVEFPDGTMTIYDYYSDWNYRTNTVWHGAPNAGKTAVIKGRKNTTVYTGLAWSADAGVLYGETTHDIESGIKIGGYNYPHWDIWNRPTTKQFLDGSDERTTYGCCGIESFQGRDGQTTTYAYDNIGRRILSSKAGTGIDIVTNYNSAGNITNRTRTIPGPTTISLESMGYDLAGRMINHTNAHSGVTTTVYSFGSNGESIITKTYPNSGTQDYPVTGTEITQYCVDGTIDRITGTAVSPVRYEYGVEQLNGVWRLYTKRIALDASGGDTDEWTKTYVDMLGRHIRTVYAASSVPYPFTESTYNNKGQLVKQKNLDGIQTLYKYNDLGEVEYTALDKDQDGVIDYSGSDRISRVERDVVNFSGTDTIRTRNYQYLTENSNIETLVSETHVSADGNTTWSSVYRDASTPVRTKTSTVYHYPSGYTNPYGVGIQKATTVTYPDDTTLLHEYTLKGEKVMTQRKDKLGNVLEEKVFEYDGAQRLTGVIDKRNGKTSFTYNDADLVASETIPTTPPQVTTRTYYPSLREKNSQLPDGSTVHTEYHPTGSVKKKYGSQIYPVEYTYDSQGRLETMKTWKDYSGQSGTATTKWNYDDHRGWLTSKDYPNETDGQIEVGNGPIYTYTDAGKLKTRKSKRNITTTYDYDNALGDLLRVTYSDNTLSVTNTYKRNGLLATTARGGMKTTMTYNDAGFPTSELHTDGILDGHGMEYTYDSVLRKTNARTKVANDNFESYSYYDANTGRLNKITHSDGLFGGAISHDIAYTYEPHSSLISQIDFGTSSKLSVNKTYDTANRLTSINNQASGTLLHNRYDYAYNNLNQRTVKLNPDGSYWEYEYDDQGQVISGKKYWPDGTLADGQDFEYAFDDIGNRTSTGGRDSAVSTYNANYLNEYTSRTVAGKINVLGVANPTASVTVNGNTATRKGDHYHYALSVSNGSNPVHQSVTSTSNYGGGQSVTTKDYVAKSPEAYTYDEDGNLDTDGRWDYTWDAENRLTKMEAIAGVPSSADFRLEFDYDAKGRRVQKKVWDSNNTLVLHRKYLYDQWNLQAELDGNDNLIRKYVWGPDLSGTTHGAGGVGGLLLICDVPSAGNKDYYFVGADGNGNVTVLANANTGIIEGRYEYGPFGEPLRASGSAIATKNPFRFSSKYTDSESGYLYYGFRYYNPEIGRWLSRDPIGEVGGINLYGFVLNNPVIYIDPLGNYTFWEGLDIGAHFVLGGLEGLGDGIVGVGKMAVGVAVLPFEFGQEIGSIGIDIAEVNDGGAAFESHLFNTVFDNTLDGTTFSEAGTEAVLVLSGYRFGNQLYDQLEYGAATGDYSGFSQGMGQFAFIAGSSAYGLRGSCGQRSASNNLSNATNGGGRYPLALYDPKFAATQVLEGGQLSLSRLKSLVPDGTPNTFKPSSKIEFGQKYRFEVNGTKMEVKFHSLDLNAAQKFPGSNAGTQWTAQIKVGNKLLGADGKFYNKPSNNTHIPIMELPK